MGLLDDAIREHLELKRRRGADPGEIDREEAEALGPVRREESVATREAEPSHHYEPEPAGLEEPGAAYAEEEAPAPRVHHEPAPEPVVHPGDEPVLDHRDVTPPQGDPLLHQPTREFSAGELEEALGGRPPRASDPEIAAEPPAPAAPAPAPAGEAGEAGEQPGEDEDVLEETPEFLQETPEHDRLWFEQKPPKDFDF